MRKSRRKFTVFVYGTLKRGYGNHRLIKQGKGEFVGTDEAPGVLYGRGGIPVVTPSLDKPDARVKGEVFRVDTKTLAHLDRLEGHPHGYTRIEVVLRSGRRAGIYYWLHAANGREHVPMGPCGEAAAWSGLRGHDSEQMD